MVGNFRKRIYGYECDIYGHLNNANYLHVLEAARSEALQDIEMPVEKLLSLNWHVYLNRIELEFIKPAMLDDIIEVRSRLTELNKVRSTWLQEIYNSHNELCFRAYVHVVHVFNGKPARVTDEIYAHFMRFVQE